MICTLLSTVLLVMTLNEFEGMKKIMSKVDKKWVDRIVIVDGGSTDGTIEEAIKMGFEVITQTTLNGYGGAILTGVNATTEDNIILFSPDGNHEVEDIKKLSEKIVEDYDQIIITRFGKNSINLDAGLIDRFGNKMFVFLANVLFEGNLTDTLTGCRAIKRKAMLELKIDALSMDSTQQMSIRGLKKKQKIFEIVGNEWHRIGGKRKMRPLIVGAQLSWQIIKEFIFWKI